MTGAESGEWIRMPRVMRIPPPAVGVLTLLVMLIAGLGAQWVAERNLIASIWVLVVIGLCSAGAAILVARGMYLFAQWTWRSVRKLRGARHGRRAALFVLSGGLAGGILGYVETPSRLKGELGDWITTDFWSGPVWWVGAGALIALAWTFRTTGPHSGSGAGGE